MRIAVLGGAGAMGAVFGTRLRNAGHDVTLIDPNAEAIARIASEGVTLETKAGEKTTTRVAAATSPAGLAPVDLAINFVKCYHTEAAIQSILPALAPQASILSLQNGWGNAPVIARIAGADRIFMGVTYHSATVLGPGHVLHAAQGNTFVGPLTGDARRAEPLVQALIAAGLEATLSPDVRKDIWAKLSLNVCTLPTSALLRFGAGELVKHDGTLALMRGLLREAAAVARAHGVPLDEEERWQVITGLLEKAGPSKSSMLQDVEKGRRTEIDVINGAILALAEEKGLAAPLNQSLVWLIKSIEETFTAGVRA